MFWNKGTEIYLQLAVNWEQRTKNGQSHWTISVSKPVKMLKVTFLFLSLHTPPLKERIPMSILLFTSTLCYYLLIHLSFISLIWYISNWVALDVLTNRNLSELGWILSTTPSSITCRWLVLVYCNPLFLNK